MRILCFFITILLSNFAISQSNEREVSNPEKLHSIEFKLNAERIAPESIKLPFSSIKIIDSRFDTSKIGFISSGNLLDGKKNSFKKLILRDGVKVSIEKYYNDYYNKAFIKNEFELLIVIKRFWFSGIDYTRSKAIDIAGNLYAGGYVYCKWEYYLGKDGNYLPAKRIDTIIKGNEDLGRYVEKDFSESNLAYLKFILKAMIEVPDFSTAIALYGNQTKKTLTEISEFNNRRNELPILKDSIFKQGVYLSFNEFKNNNPSIKNYKEKKMSYKLFKKEQYLETIDGQSITNYWGYSDGEYFRYGKFGNDKIYRKGNTFQFFIQATEQAISDNSGAGGIKYNINTWMPYQFDMETGLFY